MLGIMNRRPIANGHQKMQRYNIVSKTNLLNKKIIQKMNAIIYITLMIVKQITVYGIIHIILFASNNISANKKNIGKLCCIMKLSTNLIPVNNTALVICYANILVWGEKRVMKMKNANYFFLQIAQMIL